ncbi:MAG TPA: TonB-dependent receptor [Blastocatellia bacterium]|nr:TonB-dependent receptor [Blastocatellia bacterium]
MKKTIPITLSLLLLLANAGTIIRAEAAGPQAAVELRGTVIDETNAYIPAARVALDDGQGHKYDAQTDEHGRYRFSVRPGLYTLTVEVEGFAKFVEQVDLTQRRRDPFDVKLKVVISEQVEVKDDAAAISTEPDRNLSAITITEKELEALPDDPDELLQTLKQMAGAGGGDDASVYIGGFRERGQLPPKEAIQRININVNPYSAEYSEPGSFRIDIVTKPGADTYHGGFNFGFNDESLNARDPFAAFRAPLQTRRYGGYFSGPIKRNRAGFFADFQRQELDENDVVSAIILNPITLLPEPFGTTVLSPRRFTNFSVRTDLMATKKHTLGLQYRHSESKSLNAGGLFVLPERAARNSSSEDTLRFSLTTIASERAVNELRLQASRRKSDSRALFDGVAINVLDAFNGGGGQQFTDNVNRNLDFTDTLTYSHKTHTIKAGFRAEAVQLNNNNLSNFGGTYTFSSDFERDSAGALLTGDAGALIPISPIELYSRVVRGVPGYRASQFSINRGDPFIGFSQWQYGLFAQDDWRVSPTLTLSYGVRHEFQTHLRDKLNFAPRFSVAWTPDKKRKSTIRGGGGIFYNYLDTGLTSDSIRLDGFHQQQFVIQQPNFFPNVPDSLDGATRRQPTIRRKAADLNSPYTTLASVSYERQLPWKIVGSVSYSWTRGIHLLRTRNVNAPLRFENDQPVLPFPGEGPILQFESTGLSTRHEMRVNVRTGFSRTFSMFANYTLASTRSSTDGAYTNPADPYDLSNEFGRAAGDARHAIFIGGSLSLPWGLRVNPFINARSGTPFNITTGRDNNRDNQFTDRPAFANPGDPGAIETSFGVFNPDPRPGDEIIPRNFGQGPGFFTANVSVSKTFGFGPPPNNFPGMAARGGDSQNNSQANRQGANQQASNQRGNNRGNRGGNQGGNRGGGAGGAVGGGAPVMMRGGPGGGGMMAGGGGFFGGDNRHRYNLTFSINALNVFNHPNFGQYNGVVTSSLFGLSNGLSRNMGAGARRVEASVRFNF